MDAVGVPGAVVQPPAMAPARSAARDSPRLPERPAERPQDRPAERTGDRPAQRTSTPAVPPAAAPTLSAKATAGAASAPLRLSAMPAEWRKQLPALTVSGSVYSPDAPARMLILNGQILREGQNAGGDLLVERIGPKAAVLSFRGQRFELPYGP
jgi:general secretion pathway protein B